MRPKPNTDIVVVKIQVSPKTVVSAIFAGAVMQFSAFVLAREAQKLIRKLKEKDGIWAEVIHDDQSSRTENTVSNRK